MRAAAIIAVATSIAAGAGLSGAAAPITTNTALPVAQGEYVFREQGLFDKSGRDPSGEGRKRHVAVSESVLGYGVTGRFAVFGLVPVLHKTLKGPAAAGGHVERGDSGLGDIRLFARYTAYKRDRPGRTFRIAPFLGIELPTGSNSQSDALGLLPPPLQLGSGSWDPFGGVVVTYQTLDFQVDLQAAYQANTGADGFEFGDVARLDGSLQYRIWPPALTAEVTAFVYGVAELNLVHRKRDRRGRISAPNSGGTTLSGLLGLQHVTARRIFEGGIELPLLQNLNGPALEREFIARAGFRFNF